MGKSLLRFAESASSNIVLYSRFIWLNGSIILIQAETERYDIVRFSKATTKSLVRVKLQVTRSLLVCRPFDFTSGDLNKTSVGEKSRGVYLPIG